MARVLATVLLGIAAPAWSQASAFAEAGIDPLTATIDTRDAERFAALWRQTSGAPTAARLQSDYLDGAGPGVAIFTPYRIETANNLAAAINANRALYADAIERCLPWVAETNAQLRATFLALRGLLPDRPLPRIYLVVGANNSGGTAGPGAQVLGLEVLCREAKDRDAFRAEMRSFFAHETVHTLQQAPGAKTIARDPLLTAILAEGVADYIAGLVTATAPSPVREQFGQANEAAIWAQFLKDRTLARDHFTTAKEYDAAGRAAFDRWLYNGGKSGLPGWPADMGYWLGSRIAATYVARARDPHSAVRALLRQDDPGAILTTSGYAGRPPAR